LPGFIRASLGGAALSVILVLFTVLQILSASFVIQVPIGASLGFDSPTPDLMQRTPRPADEKILTWPLAICLVVGGLTVIIFSIAACA
jgi:magnesium-transporting ATPase (P-type)